MDKIRYFQKALKNEKQSPRLKTEKRKLSSIEDEFLRMWFRS